MRTKILGFWLVILFLVTSPCAFADAGDQDSACGTVSGTIKVVGSRVKTEGAKSDKHVVVYLEKVGGADYPAPAEKAEMDQEGLVFVPHAMAVQKGTTIDFLNSDHENHNIFCVEDCCAILEGESGKKPKFMDLGNWGYGEVRTYTFNIPGVAVLLCRLHPEMAAYVVVLESPYFAVVEIDGDSQSADYTIENVPAGQYVIKTWNKRCESPEEEVTVDAGATTTKDIELHRKSRRRR